MDAAKEYDYVVIGSGSSGSTIAGRLAENADISVLLLEAGGHDRDLLLRVPMLWARNAFMRRHDWGYDCEPEDNLDGQIIPMHRGRILGGSSSINGMTYARGHRGDYDRWASFGLAGWAYEDVLPYFRKAETWSEGEDAFRGGSGPLQTSFSAFSDPLADAILEAGRDAGYGWTHDYNGEKQEGFAIAQLTVHNGRRCSAADAYLHSVPRRSNLSVETNALATRIVVTSGRVTAVEYIQRGKIKNVRVAQEAILCGGAINTPQLMLLSGIGDPEELGRHDIDVVHPLLGVGQNLQDHVAVDVAYERRRAGPLHRALRADRVPWKLALAFTMGRGTFATVPNHILAHLRIAPNASIPDVQFAVRMAPGDAAPHFPGIAKAYNDGFGGRAVLLRPKSRGRLTLRSSDPRVAPRIDLRLLTEEADRLLMRESIRRFRDVMSKRALAPFRGREIGPETDANAALDAYITRETTNFGHPLGTCKMGVVSDEFAVTDEAFRVHGLSGLRIVDASVMPDHIGANLNAPAIMIGEKAADIILRPSLSERKPSHHGTTCEASLDTG